MPAGPLIRLAVRVASEQAELVLAELLELAPGGIEEVDLADGRIEYAVYGAPGELPTLPALTAAAGPALVEIASRVVPDGWEERWRQFHRPLVLGSRLAVRPPWEPATGAELEIVIDPGRAFGTGAHASTALCLELLLELEPTGRFVDVGCGSGVLALAAARLGFAPVLALDNDEAAIEATLANAAANGIQLDQVQKLDLRGDPVDLAGATVAANLLAPLLNTLAARGRAGGVPAFLIASGLLPEEADAISVAFAESGLAEVERRERSGWAALLLAPARAPSVRAPAPAPSVPARAPSVPPRKPA